MTTVKAFISYSWSNPEHEDWVLRLATDLRESGVDAILDKWDLKEGHEANAFMEQMVSDPDIQKVIIVSDEAYAHKSNARKGGAGTEAQIISKEIFEKQDQSKFVAVVTELDENGKPFVPAYYTSRIFIDFTDESKFATSFEQLLRWVVNKPIHRKPELGALPKYILDPDDAITLGTSTLKRRAMDGITNSKPFAYAATKEYFEVFWQELEKFRFPEGYDPLSDEIMDNFQSFIPYRDEFLEVTRAISNYTEGEKWGDLIHAFFERIQSYFFPPEGVTSYREMDFDNFKLFAHEMYLHTGAVLVSEGRYELFNLLVERPYYLVDRAKRGQEPMKAFTELRHYLKILEHRNQSLNLRRVSLAADMLHDRCASSGRHFGEIMQVDFLLFIRAEMAELGDYDRWFPDTLLYLDYGHRTFEIFERSRSTSFFERIKPLLGNASKVDLEQLVQRYRDDPRSLPRWQGTSISPSALMGISNLCTKP